MIHAMNFESDCLNTSLPLPSYGTRDAAESISQGLRLKRKFLFAAVAFLPIAAVAGSCESGATARGLSGSYLEQAVAACKARGDHLRKTLPQNPVAALQAAGALCAYSITMNDIGNTDAPWDRIQSAEIMDELAPAAVKSARGNADLQKAVKEFYAAASTHCTDGSPLTEQIYQAKSKALQLEARLAGIK